MNGNLLPTKLYLPRERPFLVARPQLIEKLTQSVQQGKLTLIAAPAGYGKSTLLVQWACASQQAIAWLSLDEADNDVVRFLRYLLAAWATAQPSIHQSQLATHLSDMTPDVSASLAAFIQAATDATPLVFVLDDYHLLDAPAIHEALTFLLDHLPPQLHFVLLCRDEPPLPLARYRARRELQTLTAADLRFSAEETEALLTDKLALDLPTSTVQTLQTQLEGWIAGLQLASLTLPRQMSAPEEWVLNGRHRFIADYLGQEVLDQLPKETQTFLLQTSILAKVCAGLATAVTHHPAAQDMLESLEQANLFLIPLDDKREWFRYHHLFADFLRQQLNRRHADEVANLHRRAAQWYFAADWPEPAFHHALTAQDADIVAQIGERYFATMLHSGQLKRLKQWLDAIPAEWHLRYPVIGLTQAGWLAMTGSVAACMSTIDAIQQSLVETERPDKRWQLARVNSLCCQIACFQNDLAKAEPLASRALQDLPESDHHFQANIHHTLGDTYRTLGRWREAREQYRLVLGLVDDPSFQIRSVHVYGALADLELRQGQLRQAYAYWDKALAVIDAQASWGRLPLSLMGWVNIRMGEIEYEWNDLDTARDHLKRGLERVELSGDVRATAVAHLLLARLELTTGDLAAAGDHLAQARPLQENSAFAEWNGRYQRLQLEYWLAQNDKSALSSWAEKKQSAQSPDEETRLALARVLIAQDDKSSRQQAVTLLQNLILEAKVAGRLRINIEALALTALAHWQHRERAGALTTLNQALQIAEPEGYLRLFVDLGLPLARLLQEARSRAVRPEYINRLLAACDKITDTAAGALPEPLTSREQEILALMAAGLTNKEIAAQLVISPQTVKKHAGHIYGKLAVHGRTAAAARARELGLLDV